MAVYQFGGETDIVGHHHAGIPLIGFVVGGIGQAHPQAATRKESMPKGIVLEHIQATGYADGQCTIRGRARTVEQQLLFLLVRIEALRTTFPIGEDAFASVTRIVTPSVSEGIGRYPTLVLTALAMQFTGGERCFSGQLVQRYRSLLRYTTGGIEGTTISPHQFGQVATNDLGSCQQFDGTHHGIIAHRAALYEDMLAQSRHIFQFQYFIEAILHHGIGQAGGNVLHRSPFAQHLLHLGVHEDRAAGAQITRMLGTASQAGKLGRRIAQVLSKGLDKRAATGGAGLIDFNTVDDSVGHKHGLHVLTADVEDEGHLLVQMTGRQIMGDGFHNAPTESESCFYQVLAIAGGATSPDIQLGTTRPALLLQFPQAFFHRANRIAFIIGIIGIYHPRLFVGHDNLGCGGAGVYAHEYVLRSLLQRCLGHGMFRHAHLPQAIFHLVLEDRRKSSRLPLAVRGRFFPKQGEQLRKLHLLFLSGGNLIQSSTQGGQLRAVGRQQYILVFQGKIILERFPQSRHEGQRSSAKEYGRLDVAPVSQGNYRLHRHCMEDGGRNVLTAHIPGHQVLDIRLAEHPATRGNGIDFRATGGQLVQLIHLHTQYDGHLVNESSRAARTIAIHTQVLGLSVSEEDHLGILSADIYQGLHPGIRLADGPRGRHHLLHERQGILLRHTHADGAGDAHGYLRIVHRRRQLFQTS